MSKGFFISPVLLFILGSLSGKRISISHSVISSSDFYVDYLGRVIWKKDHLPFYAQRNGNSSQEFIEAWKRAQPVRAQWFLDKKNKKIKRWQGKEAINLIRDYTFRLVNTCVSGTIWILDYELPKGSEYPTKFFFGTNAHIVEGIDFVWRNPYKQILPSESDCSISESFIFRETNLEHLGWKHFMPSQWNKKEMGLIEKEYSYHNVENWLSRHKYEPPYYYYKTNDIKLVYVATDFAGDGNDPRWGWCNHRSRSYISDFAVIEIDFKNPDIAKRMTRDFHNKYNYKTGTHRDKAIDFFARPLMERKSNKDMYEESIDIFLAGHPSNGLKGRSVGNYNLEKRQTSKLTYVSDWNMLKDEKYDEIIGHSNVCHLNQPIESFGTYRFQRGVELLIEKEPLKDGSSGSLTTDGERNAIGVKSRRRGKVSAIDVFRSPEIKTGNTTIIPAYDLLEGIEDNFWDRSYKDVVVSYMLRKNRNTHLSEMRKWGTTDSEALKPSKLRKNTKQLTFKHEKPPR